MVLLLLKRLQSHAFAATGTYTVTITVTYTNNTTESGSVEINVVGYKWDSLNLNFNGLTGYVKTSNPVFSPDGKTMYIPTSTPAGHLFALDVVSGEFKWVFAIDKNKLMAAVHWWGLTVLSISA